ncbi:MFS transporter [Microbacterium azadirachtae]|uniref:Major Facilitator Superfamily protein n=1 Tax=Microbacterium azadirachtae TaxID=582680 RepID=A0A0F0LLN7_9MICO|nr:MFS transporter [Microbacterium azadirachtae]KJL34063.1 Major Facilitator Superfamily protein [Microbacterium azadirachtae]
MTSDPAGTQTMRRSGPVGRIIGALDDPVLRALVTATTVARIGRGVFLTITVLYFIRIVGLDGGQAAIVLAAASGSSILASFLGGWLADRWSARRLSFAFEVAAGLLLVAYAFVGSFATAIVLAVASGFLDALAQSSRSAVIARGFTGENRVHARAVLRTVTNLSIAAGSGIAAIALAIGTPLAYRIVIVIAGVICAVGAIPLLRLPSSVDAARRVAETITTETGSVNAAATAAAERELRRDWRARSPWRDPRYLLLTLFSAAFGMQFGVAEVGVPLWIAHATTAPDATVSVLLIANTVLVVLFQVRFSRNTHDLRVAGKVSLIAGVLMAGACLVYASAAGLPVVAAIAVLLIALVAHTFAEILSQAGGWGLSFELADPVRAGAYQGVFGMTFSIGSLVAPLLVNGTAIALGFAGWAILAVVFLGSALGVAAIAFRAARQQAPQA